MTVHALPNYRPDCAVCGCPMDGHYGDGGDAGCRGYVFPEVPCPCPGYYYPFERSDYEQPELNRELDQLAAEEYEFHRAWEARHMDVLARHPHLRRNPT